MEPLAGDPPQQPSGALAVPQAPWSSARMRPQWSPQHWNEPVWRDHGWTAAGYRVPPDGSPISIRPTSPVYGLGPDFEGDRLLGAWERRPDMRPDDPRNTIDYVELYHFVNADEGGPFVIVRSTIHRAGTPRPPAGVRGIGVSPLTMEETETQASFWLASRVRDVGEEDSSTFQDTWRFVETIEWKPTITLVDGRAHPFRIRQTQDSWCFVGDFDDHSVAVMGYTMDPTDCSLVQFEVIAT